MNFLELVKTRQSVRKYSAQAIEPDKIEQCIEAARLAPSACNSQPWKFIILNDEDIKNKVARETFNTLVQFNKFVVEAPLIVVVMMENPKVISQIGGRLKNKDFYLMDVGIAAEHFCLQAAELGLGTCILGWFNEKKIAEILKVPKNKRIGLIITVGYPHDTIIRTKIRKSTQEILKINSYD